MTTSQMRLEALLGNSLELQKLDHRQFFEISCSSEDEEHIYALGEEYDVSFVCR